MDLGTGELGARIPLGDDVVTALALLGGTGFASTVKGRLYEVDFDAGTARVVRQAPELILSLRAGDDLLWIALEGGTVGTFDPATGEFKERVRGLRGTYHADRVIDDELWVASGRSPLLALGADGVRRKVTVPGEVNDLIGCGGAVWLSQQALGGRFGAAPGLRKIRSDGTVLREFAAFGDGGPHRLGCRDGVLWAVSVDGRVGLVDATA